MCGITHIFFSTVMNNMSIQNNYSPIESESQLNNQGDLSKSLNSIILEQSHQFMLDSKKNIFQEIENKIKNYSKQIFEEFTEYTKSTKISDFMNNHNLEDRLKKLEKERNKDIHIQPKDTIDIIEKDFSFNVKTTLSQMQEIREKIIEHFVDIKNCESALEKEIGKLDTSFQHINHLKKFGISIQEDSLQSDFTDNIEKIYEHLLNNSPVKDMYSNYKKLLLKHKYYLKCLQELKALSNKPTCPFCLTNDIDTVLIPCGHSCCNQCIMQLGDRCGACRSSINKVQRLYII